MKIGFLANGEMFGWEAKKLMSFIKETGYDSVELIDDIIFANGKDAKDMRAAADEYGVTISEILTQHDFVLKNTEQTAKNAELVIENMKKAADIGVNIVNVFTGPVPWMPDAIKVGKQVSMTEAWGDVFSAFDKIVPAAEKLGVKVAVENVWGMLAHDFYTNKFLNEHYKSDNLGVNLDPSHDALYGNTDTAFLVKSWGKKVFHVHLKDAVGIAEDGKFVFPLIGEGIVNFKALFEALKEIGYDGTCSVEFESWAYRANTLGGVHSAAAAPMLEAVKRFL